jgi:hypothetical protein
MSVSVDAARIGESPPPSLEDGLKSHEDRRVRKNLPKEEINPDLSMDYGAFVSRIRVSEF